MAKRNTSKKVYILVNRKCRCYTPIALVTRKRFITVTSKIRNIFVFTRNRILIVIMTYKNKDIAVFMGTEPYFWPILQEQRYCCFH